jgi:hypothetical protein
MGIPYGHLLKDRKLHMKLKKPLFKYDTVMLIEDNEIDNFINQRIIEGNNFAEKIFVNTSKIIENRKIADNYFLMRFENKNKDIPLPGQFINLKVNDNLDPLLRRPFAVFEYSKKDISILLFLIFY